MSDIDSFLDGMTLAGRPSIQKQPWMSEKVMKLVTPELLPQVINECIESKLYSLDLETTGLDNRVFNGKTIDSLVGACLSPDGEKGYYVPVNHFNHKDMCVPWTLFHTEMQRLIQSPSVAIFHNGKFDHEFLQFHGMGDALGEWDSPTKWEDTLILAYLRNTRERNKKLKFLAKMELGMEMIELHELFTQEEVEAGGLNFGQLDPTWEPALWYGASDAICTYLLYQKLKVAIEPVGRLPGQKNIYAIEKLGVAATRWMERNRVPISRPKVEELIKVGQREWLPALKEVYEATSKALGRDITPGYFRLFLEPGPYQFNTEEVGASIQDRVERARIVADSQTLDPMEPNGKGGLRVKTIEKRVPGIVDRKTVEVVQFPLVYDVLIPSELGLLLRELGVQGLSVTEKNKQIATSKEELERVLEEAGDRYPYISKVKRFREVAKAVSVNLQPIFDDMTPERSPDGRVKVNFEGFKTDTARFSTPQPKDKLYHGTVRWNLHSIPATYIKDRPECMLRIREAVEAKPGYKIVAIDYSGQELRIITNLSGEPLWVTEFYRCGDCGQEFDRGGTIPPPPEPPPPFCPKCGSDRIGDLHTLTSLAIFGEVDNKEKAKENRQKSKTLNFAMSYGGSGQAAQRAVDCSKEEGMRIKRQFDGRYKGLAGWWKSQHEYAKANKCVLTAFQRRYPLPDIDSAEHGFRAKAERNSVNGPVQGTGADLMKLAMGLIYTEFKKRGWLYRVKIIITIHDELVFEIEDGLIAEAIPVILDIMLKRTTKKLQWRVGLTADVEAGVDWSVPWNFTKIKYGKAKVPPELVEVFKNLVLVESKPGAPENGTPVVPNGVSPNVESPPPNSSAGTPLPSLAKGEVFSYLIQSWDLNLKMANLLAATIARCRGRGPSKLNLVTEKGEPLWDGEPIYVNPAEFTVLMDMREILYHES